ncbi:MAG: helicase HerA-like domain-containing protein, partial [Methylobacterium sp.]
ALIDAIEQVVRLIRSKGVGVYFVTQNPLDVPDKVGAQLGNRVQHALRAFTPREQKALKAAAETFRPNPKFRTAEVITNLGVGEALVSVLEGKGAPSMVERTLVAPPGGRVGPITPQERAALMRESPFRNKYTETADRESAFEMLAAKAEAAARAAQGGGGLFDNVLGGLFGGSAPAPAPTGRGRAAPRPQPSMAEKIATSAARSVANTVGRQIGTAIVRGVLGSLLGERR